MANTDDEERSLEAKAVSSAKKIEWILMAVALVLTVLSIVAIVVGMDYMPKVYDEGIDNKGVPYKFYKGLFYEGLDSIYACEIAAVIGNFLLFVMLQEGIWFSKKTIKVSLVSRIVKIALHIIGTMLVVALSVAMAAQYVSSNAYRVANVWIMGAYGMCPLGEIIMLLVYYWNERLARGPAGADDYYIDNHKKLLKRSDRACAFAKFYIAVPYVSLLIGYFLSVIFGYFAGTVGRFMCGGIQLVLIGAALILSIVFFFRKHRISKAEVSYFHNRDGASKGRSGGRSSYPDYSDEEKPEDKGYAAGKKMVASELYDYNGLKFVPNLNTTYVSDLRVSVECVNKDSFGVSGKLILRGSVKCKIKREGVSPNNEAKEVFGEIIEYIKSRASDVIDELADRYSNYNKKFTIDCSGIKLDYTVW